MRREPKEVGRGGQRWSEVGVEKKKRRSVEAAERGVYATLNLLRSDSAHSLHIYGDAQLVLRPEVLDAAIISPV